MKRRKEGKEQNRKGKEEKEGKEGNKKGRRERKEEKRKDFTKKGDDIGKNETVDQSVLELPKSNSNLYGGSQFLTESQKNII